MKVIFTTLIKMSIEISRFLDSDQYSELSDLGTPEQDISYLYYLRRYTPKFTPYQRLYSYISYTTLPFFLIPIVFYFSLGWVLSNQSICLIVPLLYQILRLALIFKSNKRCSKGLLILKSTFFILTFASSLWVNVMKDLNTAERQVEVVYISSMINTISQNATHAKVQVPTDISVNNGQFSISRTERTIKLGLEYYALLNSGTTNENFQITSVTNYSYAIGKDHQLYNIINRRFYDYKSYIRLDISGKYKFINFDYVKYKLFYQASFYMKYLFIILCIFMHKSSIRLDSLSLIVSFLGIELNTVGKNIFLNMLFPFLFDEVMSIPHLDYPISIHVLRTHKILKSLQDPENCLVRILRQPGYFVHVSIKTNHIEPGPNKISKKLLLKLYLSGGLRLTGDNVDIFSRLSYLYNDKPLFILRQEFVEYLFSRQGYTRDMNLFKEVFNNTSPVRRLFLENLPTASLQAHKVNCFIQKNVFGVTNGYIERYRIALVKIYVPLSFNKRSYETERVETEDEIKIIRKLNLVDEIYLESSYDLYAAKTNYRKRYNYNRSKFEATNPITILQNRLSKSLNFCSKKVNQLRSNNLPLETNKVLNKAKFDLQGIYSDYIRVFDECESILTNKRIKADKKLRSLVEKALKNLPIKRQQLTKHHDKIKKSSEKKQPVENWNWSANKGPIRTYKRQLILSEKIEKKVKCDLESRRIGNLYVKNPRQTYKLAGWIEAHKDTIDKNLKKYHKTKFFKANYYGPIKFWTDVLNGDVPEKDMKVIFTTLIDEEYYKCL
jgi:ElaB/YqjD/DUF883 family membrane-anchored ribosome-binding protein